MMCHINTYFANIISWGLSRYVATIVLFVTLNIAVEKSQKRPIALVWGANIWKNCPFSARYAKHAGCRIATVPEKFSPVNLMCIIYCCVQPCWNANTNFAVTFVTIAFIWAHWSIAFVWISVWGSLNFGIRATGKSSLRRGRGVDVTIGVEA